MKILEIRVTRKRCVYCAADVMAAAFVALLLLCMDCVLPCHSCPFPVRHVLCECMCYIRYVLLAWSWLCVGDACSE